MEDKRKHTRLPLKFNIQVKTADGRIVDGYTKNISFGGTCIVLQGKTDLKSGQEITITLLLQPERGLSINFNCQVIHTSKKNAGLKFLSIEGLESYEHFKNLMVYNHKQPDHLLQELAAHPGLIIE
ncbi:MAG: PilZ domain-containing protein [Spirochaetales bacterium]|nr:PilZ domain-containing protein [Spirochaetales bacterium]